MLRFLIATTPLGLQQVLKMRKLHKLRERLVAYVLSNACTLVCFIAVTSTCNLSAIQP
jgi:hypothetical protein